MELTWITIAASLFMGIGAVLYKINRIIPSLKQGTDYQLEEKSHTAFLTEEGVAHVEKFVPSKTDETLTVS